MARRIDQIFRREGKGRLPRESQGQSQEPRVLLTEKPELYRNQDGKGRAAQPLGLAGLGRGTDEEGWGES